MRKFFAAVAVLSAALCCASGAVENGFTSLFDGQTLNGWRLIGKRGEGYGVKSGLIYCAKGGGGRLMTEKEYGNFIFRLQVKMDERANNSIGIRLPLEGDSVYTGMGI